MQLNRFNLRIRKVPPSDSPVEAIPSPSPSPEPNQFSQLMSMLTNILQSKPANDSKLPQMEARDREVSIALPEIKDGRIKQKDFRCWLSDVVKTTCSSAFNSFSKKEMSFEQAKIYCSENIFKNIVRLSQKYHLSAKEMEMIDDHLKNGVINYLAAKYPLTDSTDINKKLEQVVRTVDIIESLDNNYFTNSQVVFTYRQGEKYDDTIMQLLNEAMKKVDQQFDSQRTNYQQFQSFMSGIFEKVEDEDWVNRQASDGKRSNNDKEEYKEMVKEYTHYLVGRKIPESTPEYTEAQIQNGKAIIKNPQILRILTKWCEELEDKFRDDYFGSRTENFKLQKDDDIVSLNFNQKHNIDLFLKSQFVNIRQQMVELFQNNYEMQVGILENQLQVQGDEHIDFREKVSGKFSVKVIQNLHEYIITYLNRLIHSILKTAKSASEEANQESFQSQPSPPNLLSFKIGDLMRCKCSSKEKEIIRIYQEINRISLENPEKLKIVRIKNRLKSSTNDILMNVRFNNTIICEIQLAIHSKDSDFIKCSNKFHHYLYQLQRSIFGPITQLCSIWGSLDRRFSLYEKLVGQQYRKIKRQPIPHSCQKFRKDYQMVLYNKPLICSICHLTYCHNNYIRNHTKCTVCSYSVCAKCNINRELEVKSNIILGQQLSKYYKSRHKFEDELPYFGACILIESKAAKVEIFTIYAYHGNCHVLGIQNKKIYSICSIDTKQDKQNFKKKYLILKINWSQQFGPINRNQIIQQFFMPLLVQKDYRREKQSLCVSQLQVKAQKCQPKISLGTLAQKQKIRNLILPTSSSTVLPFNPSQFPNLQWLSIKSNPITSFQGLQGMRKLKILQLKNCRLVQIPTDVLKCKGLQKLDLTGNSIILDNRIKSLQYLQGLNLQSNQLKSLPNKLYQFKELKELNLSSNNLTSLSEDIGQLTKLKTLNIYYNQITELPESIGNLSQLKKVLLNSNTSLKKLPQSFKRLKKIQDLNVQNTGISSIPIPDEGWPNLIRIRMKQSNITTMPKELCLSKKIETITFNKKMSGIEFQSLHYVQRLMIQRCWIIGAPKWLFTLKNVQDINLQQNHISNIELMFMETPNIKKICLSRNNIYDFPNLSRCYKLTDIDFSFNSISTIHEEFLQNLLNIEKINISSNLLKCFPLAVSKMKKLATLIAEDNLFQCLFSPQYESTYLIGKQLWPKLGTINFNKNKLSDIPLVFCDCPYLEYLYLNNNSLKRIQPEIINSKYIRQLTLENNQISQIPENLASLKYLGSLGLYNNNITSLPSSLQTIRYLQVQTTKQVRQQNLDDPKECSWGSQSHKQEIQQEQQERFVKMIARLDKPIDQEGFMNFKKYQQESEDVQEMQKAFQALNQSRIQKEQLL